MELEVANGSWRHGLILSVRCGDVRRQAPLSYDTRIAFPQEAVAQKQVQVDVFAKVGTDTITFDPQTELYDLNIGGDCEGFSGLSLRMKTQEEAAGGLRKRIENAQATEEYIEQHDLRQFATQVTPQVQLSQGQTPVRAQPVSAGGEGAVASPTTEDRLQMARQDAADYVERFDLRQVLQNMFQRVIRERPDDPFGFMQSFLSNGSIRPWAVASVEADAAEEEQRSRRDQERDEQLAAAQKRLEQQRARIDELLAGGAAGAGAKGGGPAEPAYDSAAVAAQVEGHVQHIKALEEQLRESEARNANGPTAVEQAQRREDDHQHQLTLTRAQATAQAQRIQTLEQQLKEAKRAAERNQEIAEEAKRKAARGGSPDAEGAALEAAVHEAAAARDAAVARELAAAAAAVQEASTSRDAAVTRELATLQERTDLQRRCQGYEHNMKQLDKKLQALERKTGVTVTDKEAAAEPMRELPSPKQQEAPGTVEGQDLSQEERRFREAVRQYGELESKHRETNQRLADLERRCQEAEAQRSEAQEQLERLQDEAAVKAQAAAKAEEAAAAVGATRELEPQEPQEPQAAGEGASRELVPDASGSAKEEEAADDPAREVKLLSERVEVERRCHEQALLECQELQRKNQQITRQKTELEAKLSEGDAASQSNLAKTGETCKMLERRIQELEANAANAAATAAAQQSELSRSYEMQLDNQKTRMDMLQRKIQAYEAFGVSGDDGAGGAAQQVSPRGDAAAGGSRGSANKVGLSTTGSLRPGIATASTMPPPTASTASAAPPLAVFGASGGSEVNTHMLSQLLASTYAPPVPPTTYIEQRDDRDVEPGPPDPELLVEVVDCKDVMSNGIFAWVGVCNLRPLYRLLGPEPRYLYYVEADIASHWRIVNKMGSEEYVERFRRPTDAKLPVECEKGDAGGGVFEVKLTPEIIQRISMINSHDEKVAIRTKLLDAYGQQFVSLEGKGRGLVSKASPVVAVAHALESQQRAIQLLHSQLSVETQRREAAEQHSTSMEQAFETLQLRIQAQLPGPPSVASLQEVQAAMGGQHARAFAEHAHGAYAAGGEHGEPGASQDRGLVFEKDGKADWAPDLGPGFGPVPHPPIEPKDRKPVPPPSFRRGPSGMRNSKGSPRPIAYPVAAGAPVPDWTLPPMPEEPAAAEPIAVE